MEQPPVFLQIFASGKITFLGARSRDDVYEAFRNIYPRLYEYRKTDPPEASKDSQELDKD